VTTEHPSIDAIADYCAELLPDDAADVLAAHLAACSLCSDDAAAITHVSAVLAGDAQRPLPMPEPVRRAIDAALLDERRATGASAVPRVNRRMPSARVGVGRPLLAAAAVIVAVSGITGVVRVIAGAGNDHPSALQKPLNASPSSGRPTARHRATVSPGGTRLHEGSGPLSPQSLPSYAIRLTHAAPARPRLDRRVQLAGCAVPRVPPNDVMAVRRWHRAQAIVVVDPAARRVTVFDCGTAATVLYVSSY
jgi:hypothetical protein